MCDEQPHPGGSHVWYEGPGLECLTLKLEYIDPIHPAAEQVYLDKLHLAYRDLSDARDLETRFEMRRKYQPRWLVAVKLAGVAVGALAVGYAAGSALK